MRRRFDRAVAAVTIVFGLLSGSVFAQNAAPASLDEQLRAQYKMVKVGNAAGEVTVIEAGTVLDIQKGGIVGVIPKSVVICPSKFENGSLKNPSMMCTGMVGKQNLRYFSTGEKVYPLKLEVNPGKEKISLEIIECDSCNGVNQASSYKSQVVFQFAKGYLETASVPQVEDTISQVFAIDEGSGDTQQQTANGAPAQGQPADQAPAPPVTVQLGQTTDQVVAALGQPEKMINLGAKQIYVYKDLKVTFENGKVKDVQ